MKTVLTFFILFLAFGLSLSGNESKIPVKDNYEQAYSTGCKIHVSKWAMFYGNFKKVGGCGTGTFINNKEYPIVMTNYHVAMDEDSPSEEIVIKNDSYDNLKETGNQKGVVVAHCKAIDIALIQVEKLPNESTIAKPSSKFDYKVGDDIYYFGKPGGGPVRLLYKGFISGLNIHYKRSALDEGFFTDTMNIGGQGGNSGASVWKTGRFIGVVVWKHEEGAQAGFIPTSDIVKRASKCENKTILQIMEGTFKGKVDKPIEL
jgi:S1-C subfamily serine protease